MKKNILGAIPELFSIRGHDYSRYVVQGGAEKMMETAWEKVGTSLTASMAKVGGEIHGREHAAGQRPKKAAQR
jgi:hypothetical protein